MKNAEIAVNLADTVDRLTSLQSFLSGSAFT